MAELFNLETQNPESIILPAAEFMTDAALVRHNDDLILTLPDGREQVVEGYFAADPRPTLTLEDSSAALTPELVQSFLQEITFSGEGSATATDSQGNAIGNAETVIGEVTVVRNGEKITLEAGDPVFEGDIIETETAGSAKLRFIDETLFSISEEARLALDKMVFDPETAEGETILSMLKGGFLFISGQIAKTDPSDMQVVTPVATIGIRGTIVTGNVSPGESFEFSVVDGAIAVQPQGADEPIVMDSAFATLGGSVSESGAITTRISQDSARAVIERNAGQFATLSDADVAAIETAVTATAVQNGETVTLDLQDLIEEVVTEATADDAQDDQDTVTESPVVETSPANEPVPDDLGDETGDIDVSPVEPVTGTGDGNTEESPQDEDDDGPVTVEIPVSVPVINVLSGAISRANAILSGTAQAGTTIIVIGTLNGIEEQSFSTTTSGNGTWSVNLGADSNFEPNGETYSYSVTATDSAGTTSAPATTTVILDFVNPTDPDPTKVTLAQTGDIITVSGDYTAEPGITMVVELKGSLGNTVSDEVTVKTDGTWSIGFSGLLSGTYEASVSAKDEAGNTSGSVDATISTTSTITSYIEDWSSLTEGGTADYSLTHTAGVTITTSNHADDITTTDYNDTITSSSGNDTINTGKGNDEIYLTYDNYASGERPTSFVDAGDGDDTVIVSDKAIDIESTGIALEGGTGADTLVIYDEQDGDTVATTTGDTQIKGFETIILVDETEYDSGATDQKKITFTDSNADNNSSYSFPKGSFDADGGLTLQGSMTADDIKVENGMQAVWKDSNESNGNANTANSSTIDTITLSSGTLSSDTHLTLQANGSLTDGAAHDFVVTDSLTLEAGTTLTLQGDDNSATFDQNQNAFANGMSRVLKIGDSTDPGSFSMDEDATLAIDFLNLASDHLGNASNVIDLNNGGSISAPNTSLNVAGSLHIYANDAIHYETEGATQTIIRSYGTSYSTFDEILLLGADGSNLVGTEDDGTVSDGTDNALVAIYTHDNGIQLKAVTANEVNTATFDAADDGAYFSTTETTVSATATTSNTDGVAFYGSNNHADTFVISSAEQIAYFDGGSGDHNDTLKITDNAVQFSDIYDSSNTDDVMDFQVNRIETLDISDNTGYDGGSGNALTLSAELVKALTEDTNSTLESEGVTSDISHSLILKVGENNEARFDAVNNGWTEDTAASAASKYTVYTLGDARVYVDAE